MSIYTDLSAHFGPCRWWPAEHPFEVAVGAILTQNTAWRNVEKALDILRSRDALRPEALWLMEGEELERCLKPSGFYRLKAKRLRNLLAWMTGYEGWDRGPGNRQLDFLRHVATARLRKELLGVKGVGPETADSIALYALQRPTCVVDAYTRRLASRHGLAGADVAYEALRALFMDNLPQDVALYNEYHALIVKTGNAYCKARNPLCSQCPLGYLLVHDRLA
jgi:endonuclease-3 related protein